MSPSLRPGFRHIAVFAAGVGLAACATAPSSPGEGAAPSELDEAVTGDLDLDTAVSAINAQIDAEHIALRKVTKADVLAFVEDYAPLEMIKGPRKVLLDGLHRGVLPAPFRLEIVQYAGLPPRISVTQINVSVVSGMSANLWSVNAAGYACTEPRVCVESFGGSLPPATPEPFPSSVELRIREARTPGECNVAGHCNYDMLAIELHLTPANLEDVVGYFSHGFAPSELRARAATALTAAATDGWVRIEALMPNWVGERASTFPRPGPVDNEVCHGPARQFFETTLYNGPWDRSTEATHLVLQRFYCPLADDAPPGFGDYLYIPGSHSGRFILEDPASHRWIAFSVQSGGNAPYRFWWVDEDFSGHPFARTPLPDFRQKLVDVWRRCR